MQQEAVHKKSNSLLISPVAATPTSLTEWTEYHPARMRVPQFQSSSIQAESCTVSCLQHRLGLVATLQFCEAGACCLIRWLKNLLKRSVQVELRKSWSRTKKLVRTTAVLAKCKCALYNGTEAMYYGNVYAR